jgi:hypothetical protein
MNQADSEMETRRDRSLKHLAKKQKEQRALETHRQDKTSPQSKVRLGLAARAKAAAQPSPALHRISEHESKKGKKANK